MAELPASWGLTTTKRPDGKLDIIGKDDLGGDYRVRTTDGPQITDTDVQELKAADRESYANKEAGIREFCKGIVDYSEKKKSERDLADLDDWTEAAGPVVHAGFERKGLTVGSSRKYRQNYDSVFGEN